MVADQGEPPVHEEVSDVWISEVGKFGTQDDTLSTGMVKNQAIYCFKNSNWQGNFTTTI